MAPRRSTTGWGRPISRWELLARSLHVKDARLQPTLDAIVSAAIDTVGPAQHAGLILVLKLIDLAAHFVETGELLGPQA